MVYNVSQIKTMLTPVFNNYKINKAILFGSYSKGLETENSDVDILVDSNLHGLSFYGLLNDIVEVLDKEVDLFDYRQFDSSSPLFKEIIEKGVTLYEK